MPGQARRAPSSALRLGRSARRPSDVLAYPLPIPRQPFAPLSKRPSRATHCCLSSSPPEEDTHLLLVHPRALNAAHSALDGGQGRRACARSVVGRRTRHAGRRRAHVVVDAEVWCAVCCRCGGFWRLGSERARGAESGRCPITASTPARATSRPRPNFGRGDGQARAQTNNGRAARHTSVPTERYRRLTEAPTDSGERGTSERHLEGHKLERYKRPCPLARRYAACGRWRPRRRMRAPRRRAPRSRRAPRPWPSAPRSRSTRWRS